MLLLSRILYLFILLHYKWMIVIGKVKVTFLGTQQCRTSHIQLGVAFEKKLLSKWRLKGEQEAKERGGNRKTGENLARSQTRSAG